MEKVYIDYSLTLIDTDQIIQIYFLYTKIIIFAVLPYVSYML